MRRWSLGGRPLRRSVMAAAGQPAPLAVRQCAAVHDAFRRDRRRFSIHTGAVPGGSAWTSGPGCAAWASSDTRTLSRGDVGVDVLPDLTDADLRELGASLTRVAPGRPAPSLAYGRRAMGEDRSVCVGLDTHKAKITVAVAEPGRSGEVCFQGEIANRPEAVLRLIDWWPDALIAFRSVGRCGTLRHASGNRRPREPGRPPPPRGGRGGPEQPPEARLAGQGRPRRGRRPRHRRDRAPRRPLAALRPALARAVRAGGRRRPAARQDQEARHAAAAGGDRRPRGRADPRRAAGRGDPLDRPDDGEGGRRLPALGAAHLDGAPARPAPGAHLQALQGPGVRPQAARRGRALHAPAGARDRAVRRREIAKSRPSSAPSPGCR